MRNFLIICLLCCSSSIRCFGQTDSVFLSAVALYNKGDYGKASVEVQRCIFYGNRDAQTLDLAARIFSKLGKEADAEYFRKRYNAESAADTSVTANRKNKALARVMSAFVPGMGQYYCGNIAQGASSELLVGASTGLSVILFNYYKPFTAIFSTVPLICRFYMGGIVNAGRCAEEKL